MDFLKQKLVFNLMTSSKAQATMEYILLLVLVISIALGLAGPLGDYLKHFSGALIGPETDRGLSYYGCLTKAGRLPGDPEAAHCGMDLSQTLAGLSPISGPGMGPGGPGMGPGGPGMGPGGPGIGPGGPGVDPGGGPGDGSGDGSGGDSIGDNLRGDSDKKDSRDKKSSRHKVRKPASSNTGSNLSSGQSLSKGGSDESSAFGSNLKNNKKKAKKKKRKKRNRVMARKKGSGDHFDNKKKSKKKKSKVHADRGEGYLGEQVVFLGEEEKTESVVKVKDQTGAKNSYAKEEKKNKSPIDKKRRREDKELEDEDRGIDFTGFLKYFVIVALLVAIVMIIFSQIMEYQSRD